MQNGTRKPLFVKNESFLFMFKTGIKIKIPQYQAINAVEHPGRSSSKRETLVIKVVES